MPPTFVDNLVNFIDPYGANKAIFFSSNIITLSKTTFANNCTQYFFEYIRKVKMRNFPETG